MGAPLQVIGTTVMFFTFRDDQRIARVPQRGIGSHVRNEHSLAGLEGAPELRISGQVHHVVPDARIFVTRHQPDGLAAPFGQKDGAAVQAESFAHTAG